MLLAAGASIVGGARIIRWLLSLVALLVSGRLGLGIVAWHASEKLEKPSYAVLRKLSGRVQLRRYDSYLIAETAVRADTMRQGSAQGFRKVAGYIFGKNKPGDKMAMTAPVRLSASGGAKMAMTAPVRIQPPSGGSKMKVSFVVGKAYTAKTAPKPTDKSVNLRNVEAHVLAASTFSGPPPKEQRIAQERERVLQAIEDAGLQPESGAETLVFGYHDPFATPNFLRKNEVCIKVKDTKSVQAMAV